jgi:hypothetical protein
MNDTRSSPFTAISDDVFRCILEFALDHPNRCPIANNGLLFRCLLVCRSWNRIINRHFLYRWAALNLKRPGGSCSSCHPEVIHLPFKLESIRSLTNTESCGLIRDIHLDVDDYSLKDGSSQSVFQTLLHRATGVQSITAVSVPSKPIPHRVALSLQHILNHGTVRTLGGRFDNALLKLPNLNVLRSLNIRYNNSWVDDFHSSQRTAFVECIASLQALETLHLFCSLPRYPAKLKELVFHVGEEVLYQEPSDTWPPIFSLSNSSVSTCNHPHGTRTPNGKIPSTRLIP